MNETDLKKGQVFIFTETGVKFKIEKVTDKRVSWYTGYARNSAYNKRIERMAWVSKSTFIEGINTKVYVLT